MKLQRLLLHERITTYFLILTIFVIFLVVILLRLPYASFRGEKISLNPLDINMQQLDFAGESVIVDQQSNPL